MDHDGLEELLDHEKAEGHLDSSGVFTLDAAQARVKLARYSLRPGQYLAKLVQAGVAARSMEIRVGLNPQDLTLEFWSPDPELLRVDTVMRGLAEPFSLAPESAASYLVMGLLASQLPKAPRKRAWRMVAGGEAVSLQLLGDEVRCARSAISPGCTPRARISLEVDASSAEELESLKEDCAYAPIPVVVSSPEAPSRGPIGEERFLLRLAEHYAVNPEWGGEAIGVPSARLRESVWLLAGGSEVRGRNLAPVHLSLVEGPATDFGDRWLCESVVAIENSDRLFAGLQGKSQPKSFPGRLRLVRYGVLQPGLPVEFPCPGMVAVASARGLKTDLSGQAVQDESYRALTERLYRRAEVLLVKLVAHRHDLALAPRKTNGYDLLVYAVGGGLVGFMASFNPALTLAAGGLGVAARALASSWWDQEFREPKLSSIALRESLESFLKHWGLLLGPPPKRPFS